jgi:hypothetical protein
MPTVYVSPDNGPEALICLCSDEQVTVEIWRPDALPDARSLVISQGSDIITEIPLTPAVRAALIKALA